MADKFVNISERYGDAVEVTIDDYRELNPEGEFVADSDEIREYFSDEPGDYEVIAERRTSDDS